MTVFHLPQLLLGSELDGLDLCGRTLRGVAGVLGGDALVEEFGGAHRRLRRRATQWRPAAGRWRFHAGTRATSRCTPIGTKFNIECPKYRITWRSLQTLQFVHSVRSCAHPYVEVPMPLLWCGLDRFGLYWVSICLT